MNSSPHRSNGHFPNGSSGFPVGMYIYARYILPRPMTKTIDDSRFDMAFLREFCEGDEEQIQYFLEKFKLQWPVEMDRLRVALETEDREGVAKIAHRFRPQLDFVGLKDEAALVFDLEHSARNHRSFDDLRDIFNRIKT